MTGEFGYWPSSQTTRDIRTRYLHHHNNTIILLLSVPRYCIFFFFFYPRSVLCYRFTVAVRVRRRPPSSSAESVRYTIPDRRTFLHRLRPFRLCPEHNSFLLSAFAPLALASLDFAWRRPAHQTRCNNLCRIRKSHVIGRNINICEMKLQNKM